MASNFKSDSASRLQSRQGSVRGPQLVPEDESDRPLTRNNFVLMALCGLCIVVGFCLMLGGATTTEGFNEDIFSTRRIVVGPTICFIGFVLMAFAILYNRRQKASASAK